MPDYVPEQRPWGHYLILEDTSDHKVKRIVVHPGKRLSLQRHQHRSEHWYLLRGQASVVIGDKLIQFLPGQSINIPQGMKHRMANTGTDDLSFIEIQTGSYFGEDDIERLEDDFGRC